MAIGLEFDSVPSSLARLLKAMLLALFDDAPRYIPRSKKRYVLTKPLEGMLNVTSQS